MRRMIFCTLPPEDRETRKPVQVKGKAITREGVSAGEVKAEGRIPLEDVGVLQELLLTEAAPCTEVDAIKVPVGKGIWVAPIQVVVGKASEGFNEIVHLSTGGMGIGPYHSHRPSLYFHFCLSLELKVPTSPPHPQLMLR